MDNYCNIEEFTIKEIDKKISELNIQKKILEKKKIEDFKIYAKKNVGRCFIVEGKYCKVVSIPQEKSTMTGIDFNKYQYPAIFLTDDFVPFEEDYLFSGIWGDCNPNIVEAKEITQAEFETEFTKRINKFKEIMVASK